MVEHVAHLDDSNAPTSFYRNPYRLCPSATEYCELDHVIVPSCPQAPGPAHEENRHNSTTNYQTNLARTAGEAWSWVVHSCSYSSELPISKVAYTAADPKLLSKVVRRGFAGWSGTILLCQRISNKSLSYTQHNAGCDVHKCGTSGNSHPNSSHLRIPRNNFGCMQCIVYRNPCTRRLNSHPSECWNDIDTSR